MWAQEVGVRVVVEVSRSGSRAAQQGGAAVAPHPVWYYAIIEGRGRRGGNTEMKPAGRECVEGGEGNAWFEVGYIQSRMCRWCPVLVAEWVGGKLAEWESRHAKVLLGTGTRADAAARGLRAVTFGGSPKPPAVEGRGKSHCPCCLCCKYNTSSWAKMRELF